MNVENLQPVLDYLDKIGEKIGQGAEHIWPWLIKQQYIESTIAWIVFIICGLLWIPVYKEACNEHDWENEWILIVMISLGVASFFSLVFLFVEGFDFLNPEYWALKDLMYMIK